MDWLKGQSSPETIDFSYEKKGCFKRFIFNFPFLWRKNSNPLTYRSRRIGDDSQAQSLSEDWAGHAPWELLWCRSCRLCCMATFEKKWKMLE
jgi:hypothetical protein